MSGGASVASDRARTTPAARRFENSYREALEEFLRNRNEAELRVAYELGREAVREELSVLDLAIVHHDALLQALAGNSPEHVTPPACGFFLEALSAFEMVQRGFREANEAAALERRHAEMLRQLSNFLADASLALRASDSLEEMLQLVAEQARELIGADACFAAVEVGRPDATIQAVSSSMHPSAFASDSLVAPLLALDGRPVGSIRLFRERGTPFSELDEAVLIQLAQMAAAAVERSGFYATRERGAQRD